MDLKDFLTGRFDRICRIDPNILLTIVFDFFVNFDRFSETFLSFKYPNKFLIPSQDRINMIQSLGKWDPDIENQME